MPQWLPLVAGNTAYVASSVVFIHSVWVFRYPTPFPRWIYTVVIGEFLSFSLIQDQPY